jgi:hypothetical protein
MQGAETVLNVIEIEHWRAVCTERRTYRSGRGRRKRTRIAGTSPAAYFTRERADGKGPEPRAPRRRPISLGRRAEETDQSKDRYRASVRPHHQWCRKFGQTYAHGLRRRRAPPGGQVAP